MFYFCLRLHLKVVGHLFTCPMKQVQANWYEQLIFQSIQ